MKIDVFTATTAAAAKPSVRVQSIGPLIKDEDCESMASA